MALGQNPQDFERIQFFKKETEKQQKKKNKRK